MTDSSRWQAALCISLFMHFMLVQGHWSFLPDSSGRGQRLEQELSSSAPAISNELVVTLESVSEESIDKSGQDTRHKDRTNYLDALLEAIHARRFSSPDASTDFIGLALFSFRSMPDGHFSNISLVVSSGNPLLDKAAEYAVRSASGTVRRPSSLGSEQINLLMPVKYQYDLR